MQIKMKQALEWLAKLPETLGQPGMWTRFQFREMTDAHIANTIALLDELYERLSDASIAVENKDRELRKHQERRLKSKASEALTLEQIEEAVRIAGPAHPYWRPGATLAADPGTFIGPGSWSQSDPEADQITDPNGRKARAFGLEGGIAGYYQQSRGHGKATCKCGGKCQEVRTRELTLGDVVRAHEARAELEVTLRSDEEHEFLRKCLADRPAIEYRWREQQQADVALEIQRHYAQALGGMR